MYRSVNKYAHFDKFLTCDIYKPPSGTTEHLVDLTNKFKQWAAAINEKSKKIIFVRRIQY